MHRRSWLEWRAQRYHINPSDRIWLLFSLCSTMLKRTGAFGKYLLAVGHGFAEQRGRQRDIYPLPPLSGEYGKPTHYSVQRWRILAQFVKSVIGALNWLYAVKST